MALFEKTTTIRLDIEGMTCGNCVKHVTEALTGVSGVKTANVDLAAGTARVEAKGSLPPQTLIAAVEEAGYDARVAA